MAKLVVIGCASLDIIHVEREGKRVTYESAGGAALYTALAAKGSGISVTLVAPHPEPIPDALRFATEALDWIGPTCNLEEIPKLEILHHGGGIATLLGASWGAGQKLSIEYLPKLDEGDIVHIAALSSARSQKNFLAAVKKEKSKVSVGTYARMIQTAKSEVAELFAASDFFFMNSNEAKLLFEDNPIRLSHEGQNVFVTDGAKGATVYDGNMIYQVPALSAIDLDPTGAGDTFCGVTLGEILRGKTVEDAAKSGCAVASLSIEQVGPNIIQDRIV